MRGCYTLRHLNALIAEIAHSKGEGVEIALTFEDIRWPPYALRHDGIDAPEGGP